MLTSLMVCEHVLLIPCLLNSRGDNSVTTARRVSTAPLTVHVVDARPFNGVPYFDLSICFGSSLSWMVHHTYEEFIALDNELLEIYATQVPRLPKLRKSVVAQAKSEGNELLNQLESFKEDLETYLRVVAAGSLSWTPSVHNVKVPHPDAPMDRVKVNRALFEFFEFAEQLSSMRTPSMVEAQVSAQPVQVMQATLLNSIPTESSRHVGYDDLTLAVAARDITSQIKVSVEEFTIYLGDHIDYHIRVYVCGHQWVVSKRYSELEELHDALRELYGKDQVPSFSASRVAAWRKRDRKTGVLRQKFFGDYLNDVIVSISSWEPQGLFCTVELIRTVDGLRSKVEVTVNNFLFDFFGFKDHIAELSGDDALHAIEGQQASLPEETAQAFALQRRSDRRDRLRHAIDLQGRLLQPTTDNEMNHLLGAFKRLRDDKDIIRLFEHFLISGEVVEDIRTLDTLSGPRLVTVQSPTVVSDGKFPTPLQTPRPHDAAWGAQTTPVKSHRRFVLDKDICDMAIQKGLTSSQVLQLVEPISFNDTKVAVLRLLTPALVEMSDLQLVFDTLWFDWDKTRVEVEDLLLAEKGTVE